MIKDIKLKATTNPPGILPPDKYELFKGLVGKTVINLSSRALTVDELEILSRGLTFSPTPSKPDYSEIWLDFKEFMRRLELRKFFEGINNEDPNPIDLKFREKSKWRPPVPNKTLEAFYRAIKNELVRRSIKPPPPHKSKKHHKKTGTGINFLEE